jgi:glycosyltransferase involved in cell wall biosynthesis
MKILQLSYYPIQPPVTGGQRRIAKLRSLLTDLGHDVLTCAIMPLRPDAGPADIVLPKPLNEWVFRMPHDFEMRITHAVQMDKVLSSRVRRLLRASRPDLVWLEHPFLWPLIKKLGTPRVCYSSHNVEWTAKRDFLRHQQIFDPHCVSEIKHAEEDLSWRASFILCCSESDKAALDHLNSNVIVLANGADTPHVSDPAAAGARFHATGAFEAPTFTYVSSAHAPNLLGFVDLVVEPMRKRAGTSDVVILLVGGICRLYQDWLSKNGPLANVNVVTVPDATEDEKNLALLRSDAVLLPITNGGGTNLKTAEALLSGRPIVGTNVAFRGHETRLAAPGVYIANDGTTFHHHMMQIAAARAGSRDAAGSDRREADIDGISWDSILQSARASVGRALVNGQGDGQGQGA